MDREQAAESKKRLQKLGRALDRTIVATRGFEEVERDVLLEHLRKACEIVFGKLFDIYVQYPELAPRQRPRISSELTWSEVTLPPSVTEDQLDEVICSLLVPHWRKTAMVVIQANLRFKELGWTISDEATAARLQVLSDLDRIESNGDLRYWRNSEVRLKD